MLLQQNPALFSTDFVEPEQAGHLQSPRPFSPTVLIRFRRSKYCVKPSCFEPACTNASSGRSQRAQLLHWPSGSHLPVTCCRSREAIPLEIQGLRTSQNGGGENCFQIYDNAHIHNACEPLRYISRPKILKVAKGHRRFHFGHSLYMDEKWLVFCSR